MTFKEWYNQLSEESQNWIKSQNPWWFDKDSPDLYVHKGSPKLSQYNMYPATPQNVIQAYTGYGSSEKGMMRTLALMDRVSKKAPDLIKPEDLTEAIDIYGKENSPYCYTFIEDISQRKKLYGAMKLKRNQSNYRSYKLGLLDTIFIQEDYSKFDFSCMESFTRMMKDSFGLDGASKNTLLEILPKDMVKNAAKELPRKYKVSHSVLNDDIFDELFFGENGWTAEQRKDVINANYGGYLDDILDFLKRVVAVDHTYLRHVQVLINANTAVAKELYSLRKPADELTGNESIQKQFRLSTEIRKLMHVAACCSRQRVGKAMRSNLGAVGPLVQMYKFDFNVIYDALYPDDGPINWENK